MNRTMEEALLFPGISRLEKKPFIPEGPSTLSRDGLAWSGLRLHFSPLPNWYGAILRFDCPICDAEIDWEWHWRSGQAPGFTPGETPNWGKPVVTGAELLGYGHRWLYARCNTCQTELFAENFDKLSPEELAREEIMKLWPEKVAENRDRMCWRCKYRPLPHSCALLPVTRAGENCPYFEAARGGSGL